MFQPLCSVAEARRDELFQSYPDMLPDTGIDVILINDCQRTAHVVNGSNSEKGQCGFCLFSR